MATTVDLAFRPATYFRPRALEAFLLARVKNEMLRTRLLELLAQGRRQEVRELLGDAGLSVRDQKAFERLHPMFMGGNYLPDTDDGEVEVARISIASTTCDVTCLYARLDDGRTHYRVVDEYGGDTLTGPAETTADGPLSLGELVQFFLSAWSLEEVVEMNFEGDLEGQLSFFHASSEFYPDLDEACRQRVRSRFRRSRRTGRIRS